MEEQLIALVRSRPLLYSRSALPVTSYYSQAKALWQEVADAMGWTVAEVRRKWSHIRNSYSRHLRNELHGGVTGRGRAVSRWYLAHELAFLRPHMATDSKGSGAGMVVPTSLLELNTSPFHSTPEEPLSTDSLEEAPYFHFFKGLYGDYQELSPYKQRLFRRRCLLMLHELIGDEGGKTDEVMGQKAAEAMNLSYTEEGSSADDASAAGDRPDAADAPDDDQPPLNPDVTHIKIENTYDER